MITFEEFLEIKKYQQKGFSALRTANRMELTASTVRKYYQMEEDEFKEQLERVKNIRFASKCDQYRDEIINLINEEPSRSAANIYDHLLEEHGELPFSKRTIRRYIAQLREELGILKGSKSKNYKAAEKSSTGLQESP